MAEAEWLLAFFTFLCDQTPWLVYETISEAFFLSSQPEVVPPPSENYCDLRVSNSFDPSGAIACVSALSDWLVLNVGDVCVTLRSILIQHLASVASSLTPSSLLFSSLFISSTSYFLSPHRPSVLTMPTEIKFSNFGIPYLVEFANISIRSGSRKKNEAAKNKKLPLPPVRCPTCGHLPQQPQPAEDGVITHPGGLYIRHGSDSSVATRKISERRLVRLRTTIEEAVTKAGMVRPSSDDSNASVDSHSSAETAHSTSTDSSKKALFRGTYGQVKQAFKDAGLTSTPCAENGFENGTCFFTYKCEERY